MQPCGTAVDGTGCADVRGLARSHTDRAGFKVLEQGYCRYRHGATSCQAPSLWERACPRSRRRGGWHRLRRCSRACPQVLSKPLDFEQDSCTLRGKALANSVLTQATPPHHYPAISTQRAFQHVHLQPRHFRFGLYCPGRRVRCRCQEIQEIQETAAHLTEARCLVRWADETEGARYSCQTTSTLRPADADFRSTSGVLHVEFPWYLDRPCHAIARQ